MGKSAGARMAPADDREPLYDEDRFRIDQEKREAVDLKPRIRILGSREG
jgi:hypothetical protein